MRKFMKTAVALAICLSMIACWIPHFETPASAASEYPNTHVNTGNMAADLVAVAVSQAGYCEGSLSGNPAYASSNNYQKYGLWYDNNVDYIGVQRAAWCAAFVSWCAEQAGIPSSIVYYHAYCPYGVNWFKNQGRFQYAASRGGSYIPKTGDIVYFAPAGSSTSSHIGIVRYVSGGYVYTVEGNTSGQNGEVNEGGGVFLKSYSLSYSRLYGYGTPAYTDNSGHTVTFDSNGGSEVSSVNVKDGATLTAPSNPTRYGFNFVGWYCDPGLNDPYDFSSPVPYSFTLFAKWEEAYWGANTNLMPVDGLLVREDFQGTGQYIWPYYNSDGSVTMYNGVTNDANWSWPSAYMAYENSFDSGNDAYIYVKYNATAMFNATIDYLDADGNPQSVKLSQLAGYGDTDLPAGYNEFFVNFGQYAYDQGHLTTADGSVHSRNIKYTKVTYYVIGGLDDYVRLYDMKLTPAFEIEDPHTNLMTPTITQDGGYGSYVYDDGVLSVNSSTDAGYTITMNVDKSFDPGDMVYLLSNISSDIPFNVSVALTRADGEATMQLRKEYYPLFGLAETPDALPVGSWNLAMDLNGYFAWNGGTISETTIKSVTIALTGKGSLTMDTLQAHRGIVGSTIADGLYAEDSIWAPIGSMLPISGELKYVDFQGSGQSVWDYYNDDGSVTLYNAVNTTDYSWPSGYMVYQNVADISKTPFIHLNFRCDYAFNGEISYLDDNGQTHVVSLSTLAELDTTDFTAGSYDLYLDFAAYLNAQGHMPASGELKITKVTYYVVGTTDSYARIYDLRFTAEDSKPIVQPVITVGSPSVSFEGEIRYNIYFSASQLDDVAEMGLALFNTKVADGTVETADQVIPGYTGENGSYMVQTDGIAPKNMGDALYFRIYAKLTDGSYVYTDIRGYNAIVYANNILKNSNDANMRSLVVAMLNYGAAAQQSLNYKTDSLMNAGLTAEHQALVKPYDANMMDDLVSVSSVKVGKFAYNAAGYSGRKPSVSFDGAFAINYYFTTNFAPENGMKLYYWTLADYNACGVLTTGNATGSMDMVDLGSNQFWGHVEDIVARDIDQTVFVAAVYTYGGVEYATGVLAYSVGSYCESMIDAGNQSMIPVCSGAAVYGYYAKEYFSALAQE